MLNRRVNMQRANKLILVSIVLIFIAFAFSNSALASGVRALIL